MDSIHNKVKVAMSLGRDSCTWDLSSENQNSTGNVVDTQ